MNNLLDVQWKKSIVVHCANESSKENRLKFCSPVLPQSKFQSRKKPWYFHLFISSPCETLLRLKTFPNRNSFLNSRLINWLPFGEAAKGLSEQHLEYYRWTSGHNVVRRTFCKYTVYSRSKMYNFKTMNKTHAQPYHPKIFCFSSQYLK